MHVTNDNNTTRQIIHEPELQAPFEQSEIDLKSAYTTILKAYLKTRAKCKT